MVLALSPLPGEIDHGYLGRVMRINGFKREKELADSISEKYKLDKCYQGRFWFDMLYKISGMSSEDFAMQHTMLPFKRGITGKLPDIRHGAQDQKNITRLATYRQYVLASLCPECLLEDLKNHGMSYWRREHQIPGQLWCSDHLNPLSYFYEPNGMLFSPANVARDTNSISMNLVREAQSNDFVSRYLQLVAALYERTSSFDVAKIVCAINYQAKLKGFNTSGSKVTKELISDRIVEVFPYAWLERVFPSILDKQKGEMLHQIDSSTYSRRSTSSVIAYLLVIATIFENKDEALEKLEAEQNKDFRLKKSILKKKHSVPDEKHLIKSYIDAKGDYLKLFDILKLPEKYMKKRFLELGLPDLHVGLNDSFNPRNGLDSFFLSKNNYQDSLISSGMNSKLFDELLRSCGPNLIKALKLMQRGKVRNSNKYLVKTLIRLQENKSDIFYSNVDF